jgi:hypothetical protein
MLILFSLLPASGKSRMQVESGTALAAATPIVFLLQRVATHLCSPVSSVKVKVLTGRFQSRYLPCGAAVSKFHVELARSLLGLLSEALIGKSS